MKIRVADLTGPALAYAVGIAEGCKVEYWHTKSVAILFPEAPRAVPWNPHSNWSQGGPIIEREKIDTESRWDIRGCGVRVGFKEWYACHPKNHGGLIRYTGYGPTPLIAAMRCYVASKLGDEVEIPEELL